MNMKLAICNETYRDWEWDRAFRHAAATGYQGLEIAPFTLCDEQGNLDTSRAGELRQAARTAGLQIIGFHWLLAFTSGLHLTSPSAAVRQDTAAHLIRLAELCGELGGQVMVFGSPQQRNRQPGVAQDEAVLFADDVVRQVLPALEINDVVLAMEPLGPEETDFLNTAAETIEFCQRFQSPHLKLLLDVKAMSTEAQPIPEIIEASRDWLVHFHANDPNRRGPGMGDVPYTPILSKLSEIGYGGWVSVEVFDHSVSVEDLVEQSAANLNRAQIAAGIR